MILGIEPKIVIPKPIGARVTLVEIVTTLSIEEQYKKAGLIGVTAGENRPKPTCGVVVAMSKDPIVLDNYKLGMGVYFYGHSGQHVWFEEKQFRTLDWNDIINTLEEEEVPEQWKEYVRNFLLNQPT